MVICILVTTLGAEYRILDKSSWEISYASWFLRDMHYSVMQSDGNSFYGNVVL